MGLLSSLFRKKERVDFKLEVSNGAKLIDVRTPAEFSGGNAPGSINIPLNNLGKNIDQLKGNKVVLVCKSGGRASMAKAILKRNNIECFNAGAWQNMI